MNDTARTIRPYHHTGPIYSAGLISVTLTIPAGSRVAWIGGRWTLDEFPLDLFPGHSLHRWDAIHYGLTIPSEYVGTCPRTRAVYRPGEPMPETGHTFVWTGTIPMTGPRVCRLCGQREDS